MIAACGQLEAKSIDNADEVWPIAYHLADEAAKKGADLLLYPEITYPAYWLESIDRYRKSDIERTGAVLERFSGLAAKHKFWLIAGFVEEDGDRLYNSVAVFDRTGRQIGTARKQFLWDSDSRWFQPGMQSTVMETEFGCMGLQVCADVRLPEITATLVNRGAQFIVVPTAWVNTSTVRRTYRNIQPDFLIRARAIEAHVPFICCSKSGRETEILEYVGQSQIISDDGREIAKAPLGGDGLICAEVTPGDPHTLTFDDGSLRRVLDKSPAFDAQSQVRTCTVHVRAKVEAIADELEQAGVRVARLSLTDIDSFAPARRHALEGAQVLIFRGRLSCDALLRARASENCVFAVCGTEEAQFVIDPSGAIAWKQADWPSRMELDIARADVKKFTELTEIWAQRRVDSYCLLPDRPQAASASSSRG